MIFVGASAPLSADGFHAAVECVGATPAELWAVIAVETSGCGFLGDRRPPILYERHIFHKLTQGRFPLSDINSPDPGGYAGGPAEYSRLTRAMALDPDAALQSASWGIGQILGENFQAAGFSDAASMVAAMCGSEDAQLLAVGKFLTSGGLDRALRNRDWTAFARGYNGPDYARNNYDRKLQQNYRKYAAGSLPDLTIRAAQMMLRFLHYYSGSVDGVNGPLTESAVNAFQTATGLPATIATLQAAVGCMIIPA